MVLEFLIKFEKQDFRVIFVKIQVVEGCQKSL